MMEKQKIKQILLFVEQWNLKMPHGSDLLMFLVNLSSLIFSFF